MSRAQIQYRDSVVISGHDTVHVIHGTNPALKLEFWSHYLYEEVMANNLDPNYDYERSSFIAYRFLRSMPDTSGWKTYRDTKSGISFHYPPYLSIGQGVDQETGRPYQSLGVHRRTADRATQPFFACIRFHLTTRTFTEEASIYEWDTTRPGLWQTVQEEDYIPMRGAMGGMTDISYIKGEHWQALFGYIFSHSWERMIFFAVRQAPPGRPSLVLEFPEEPPEDADVDINTIGEDVLYTILSSITFG